MLNILLILGIVESVFFMFLIIMQKQKRRADWLLFIWLGTVLLLLIHHYISFNHDSPQIRNPFFVLIGGMVLFQGPVIYFYTQKAINPTQPLRPGEWLHLLPWALFIIVILVYKYGYGVDVYTYHGFIFMNADPWKIMLNLYAYLVLLAIPLYSLLSFYFFQKSRKKREEFYSNFTIINMIWLRNFIAGIFLSSFIMSLIFYLATIQTIRISDELLASITAGIFVVLVFFTGFIRYMQNYEAAEKLMVTENIPIQKEPQIESIHSETELNQDPVINPPVEKYQKTKLDDEKAGNYLAELLLYLKTEKPYLNPKLTLRDVSDKLGISTNHLSQVINTRLNKNFFNLINELRVKEFEDRIHDMKYSNYKLEKIALDCGFNSRTSFFVIFKKIKGLTPSKYIASINKDVSDRSQHTGPTDQPDQNT